MGNLVRTKVCLSEIKIGMTIEYNMQLHTIGKNCIKFCEFMGYSFRGDASKKTITKVEFLVPTFVGNVLR